MIRSPPDGPDGRDADRGWLSNVEPTDSCLEELLDQLRRHGCCEAAGCPQSSAQEERRRCWSDEPATTGRSQQQRQEWGGRHNRPKQVPRPPAKLRSARMTPARNPCMSNWIRPFFTFSVMMVFTEPRASMQASWIFHLPC